MGVAVQGDLVACITDLGEVIWEGLEGVAWDEECGGDVVAFEEGEEPFEASRCAEDAAGYVGWICGRTVGRVQPAGDGVHVDTVADENAFWGHIVNDSVLKVLGCVGLTVAGQVVLADSSATWESVVVRVWILFSMYFDQCEQ